METRMGKSPNWLLVCERRKKRLYLSVCADDIKVTGKTNDIETDLKKFSWKNDLGEPTSFLDHVYLGCTQRECQICQR